MFTRRGFIGRTAAAVGALVLGFLKPKPMPLDRKQAIISALIETPEGRQKLSQSMVDPLRERRRLEGFRRRVCFPEQLPDKDLGV